MSNKPKPGSSAPGSTQTTPKSTDTSSNKPSPVARTHSIENVTPDHVTVRFPRLPNEQFIGAEALFKVLPGGGKQVTCILNTPFSPYADVPKPANPTNQLVVKVQASTVAEIRFELHKLHNLPKEGIILFKTSDYTQEIKDEDSIADIHTVYWSFEGDAPSNWEYKSRIIQKGLQRISDYVTENMQTSTFLLEKEYTFSKHLTIEEQKQEWIKMNKGIGVIDSQPLLPLEVTPPMESDYTTTPDEIRKAYAELNPGWKETTEKIKERIIDIRTDKLQYETNLIQLDSNYTVLREEIYQLTGHLFPPLPDTLLYTSTFYSPLALPDKEGSKDQTWQALLSAINANNLYYQQELGKYNMLKKEECHLMSVYHQLMTRMKLWVFRERIRFVQWELNTQDIYKDVSIDIHLHKFETLKQIEYRIPPKNVPKRQYQCIDFCQCELGCFPAKLKASQKD